VRVSPSRFRALLVSASVATVGCGPGLDHNPLARPDADAVGDGGSTVPSCFLPAAAFCETFTAAAPGGRGGDLDETRWGVSRLTKAINVPQGQFNAFETASAIDCTGARTVTPENDSFFCQDDRGKTVLRQTLRDSDTAGFAFHTLRIRQPFDFSGRTGLLKFGVDAWQRQGSWFEVWLVDEPISAAHDDAPAMETLPRRGLGFVFHAVCPSGEGQNSLSEVLLVDNHRIVTRHGVPTFDAHSCFDTLAGRTNRMELRIGNGIVELWASNPDDASVLRTVARLSGLQLPLVRAYVHFVQVQASPTKWGDPADSTRSWDDIAFDGPRLSTPRAYDVPDALQSIASWGVGSLPFFNTGYALRPGAQQSLSFEGVNVGQITSATLNLTVQNLRSGALQLRWNGGAWNTVSFPYVSASSSWRAVSVPLVTSELKPGRNQLELRVSGDEPTVVANVDLTLGSDDP